MTPTPEQEAIISAVASGQNCMVSALAGAAKTSTLVLASPGLPPRSLALAFNVKIKEELTKRLPPSVKVATLNGLGHSALMSAVRAKIELDTSKLTKLVRDEALDRNDSAAVREVVEAARNAGMVPKGYPGRGLVPDDDETWESLLTEHSAHLALAIPCRKVLAASYKATLAGKIDFTDQIYFPALIAGSLPPYGAVMVDEAQDLSPLNHALLRKLGTKPQLIVVGDENQAIYAFRGADSNSMENLRGLRQTWTELTLNTTFRCPTSVVERLKGFVPAFLAAPGNAQGSISTPDSWTPRGGEAVICRNNAPLMRVALRLLRARHPVTLRGRDLGKTFLRMYRELAKERVSTSVLIARANDKAQTDKRHSDQWATLAVLLEDLSPEAIEPTLSALAKDKEGAIILSTGHRAKGLEWNTVYHLNPDLIPSEWATSEAELRQENNLRYVIESRTRDKLFLVTERNLVL